jgi:hypothetical protein
MMTVICPVLCKRCLAIAACQSIRLVFKTN